MPLPGSGDSAPRAVLVLSDLVVLARQTRLVEEIVDRGLEPVVVVGPDTSMSQLDAHRRDPRHPLSRLGEVVQVQDSAVETVLGVIPRLLRRYRIEATVCCGEVFVESAGVIAESLGLAGAGANASRVCRNKVLQRMAVPDLSPNSMVVPPRERASLGGEWERFPAVIKPAGRMYSSGVQRVDGSDELVSAVGEYPPEETLLVEEQVAGPEFSVESLVFRGEVLWSGITAKRTNEDGTRFFTETGHTCPADTLDAAEEQVLVRANAEVLRAIRMADGITHTEFRLAAEGPVMMEVAARLPGDAITMLWHLATGVPLEPAIVDMALGTKPAAAEPVRHAQQLYLEHPPGRLRDVVVDGAPVSWTTRDGVWPRPRPAASEDPARCCAVMVTKRRGDLLGDQRDSGDRSVTVVVDAPLTEELSSVARRWSDRVRIVTD